MIAKSRGCQSLAGAASLRYRMPAMTGTFGIHPDIAQPAEQQTGNLWAAGSIPAIQVLFDTQPNPSDPGLVPAVMARQTSVCLA